MLKTGIKLRNNDPRQPLEEKQMDLKNNQIGLETAKNLLDKNKFNRKALIESFKQKLKNEEFIIINKKQSKMER